MTKGNAFGFVIFGLLMGLLPTVAPNLFQPNAIDGSSTRALWIRLMAVVQSSMGLIFLLRNSVFPAVVRWLATESTPKPVWRNAPVPARALPVVMARLAPHTAWVLQHEWLGHMTPRPFLREIADEIDQVVGDTRRAA